MNEQVFSHPGLAIRTPTHGIGRFMGQMAHGVLRFAKAARDTHDAAYRVDFLAARYYAMSRAELTAIGLTRDQIPVALRRALCG